LEVIAAANARPAEECEATTGMAGLDGANKDGDETNDDGAAAVELMVADEMELPEVTAFEE
jgi:hypothetical protein